MQLTLCRHIKTNGTRCKAPSLTDGTWCYFHHRLHQRHTAFRPTAATRGYLIPGQHIELIPLEDRESVQVALSVVINALATGQLDIKRATALLYGLQLASNNAAGLQTKPFAPDVVRSVESSPEGLDLAQPGAVCEVEDTPEIPLLWEAFEDDNEDEEEDSEEEEFTDEQTKRFFEIFPANPSREQPHQDHSNPEACVEEDVQQGIQQDVVESAPTNQSPEIRAILEDPR
jgi:hypothetical protein